jgi:hypothetical protein
MEAKRPPARLSIRETLAVKFLLEGKSPSQALLCAGYAKTTIEARPLSIFQKSRVREALRTALDRRGVTTERLAKIIAKGLEAKKVQRLVVDKQVQEFEDDDNSTQLAFVRLAVDLRGEEPDRRTEGTEETYEQRVMRLRGLPLSP